MRSWIPEDVVELLLEAGEIALSYRSKMRRETKSDASIVTQADRDVEELFRKSFDRPEDGIFLIGEETVDQRGEDYIRDALAGVCYIVDPIDGTAPYSHALPHWGVSVGRAEGGRLTDGAIYLPEIREGEIVMSDGDSVREGIRSRGEWSWRVLERRDDEQRPTLISISQDTAKRGGIECDNPVQAIGTAVLPLTGILQGRFLAYVGRLKLWDVAGVLPLLLRHGLAVKHLRLDELAPGDPEALDVTVDRRHFDLEPGATDRWRVKGDLLVCPPELESWLRGVMA